MFEPKFSTTDLARRSGEVTAAARQQPVIITRRNKPLLAMLTEEEYEKLVERAALGRANLLDPPAD